jgi:hypothetical protein
LPRVDQNGKAKTNLFDVSPYVGGFSLRTRFRSMNTEKCKVFTVEFFFPTLVPRVIAYAIDSAIGKEVQRHNFAS